VIFFIFVPLFIHRKGGSKDEKENHILHICHRFCICRIAFSSPSVAVSAESDGGLTKPAADAEKGEAAMTDSPKAYSEKIGLQGHEYILNTTYGNSAGDKMDNSTSRWNTIIGSLAGGQFVTAHQNTMVGSVAGGCAKGDDNTFIGYRAGNGIPCDTDVSGYGNTFVGSQAGIANKSGYYNTFVGMDAGAANTSGKWNTFIGHNAGSANTTALSNTFVGDGAGQSTTTGSYNTFIGDAAGITNTAGHSNVYIGDNAGYRNTSGTDNIFIGRDSGFENISGWQNVFIGRNAAYDNTNGHENIFMGYEAGRRNDGGNYNTFIGTKAGYNNIGGSGNTFIGDYTGYDNASGSGNVFIGNEVGRGQNVSNQLFIDNSTVSTPLIWGDFSTNNVVIYGGFRSIASYSSSDKRWKKNIKPLESSLKKISSLQGVSYEWKTDEYPDVGMTEGKQIGLVAQDVEKEIPELVSEDKDGYKAVSYTKLTAVLVEAVKELKTENQSQKKRLLAKKYG